MKLFRIDIASSQAGGNESRAPSWRTPRKDAARCRSSEVRIAPSTQENRNVVPAKAERRRER